jgi:hypothetical protein
MVIRERIKFIVMETQTILKANELRLGNWIYLSRFKDNHQVYSIELYPIFQDGKEIWKIDGEEIEDIQPIPLTPEILEKAGAKHSHADVYYFDTRDGKLFISYIDGHVTEGAGLFGKISHNHYKRPYLHQLQNLYYALTGEELSIQL